MHGQHAQDIPYVRKMVYEKSFVMCIQAILASIKAEEQHGILHILANTSCCSNEVFHSSNGGSWRVRLFILPAAQLMLPYIKFPAGTLKRPLACCMQFWSLKFSDGELTLEELHKRTSQKVCRKKNSNYQEEIGPESSNHCKSDNFQKQD